jgi:hypothetical protein
MKVLSIRMTAVTALIAGLAAWSGAAQAYWGLDTAPGNTVGDSGNAAYTVQMRASTSPTR